MAASAGHRSPNCHVLNFFYDSDDGCALTVRVNSVRFHIIADADKLECDVGPSAKLAREYRHLLNRVKQQDEPQATQSQDSGHGTSDDEAPDQDEGDDHDSAIDVQQTEDASKQASIAISQADGDAEELLHNWLLAPFGPIFDEQAPKPRRSISQSVADWYATDTLFYNLEFCKDELVATEEESSDELQRRMRDLTPKIVLPKYIRNLGIPWYAARDVEVLASSDDPAPYHPCRVKVDDKCYFLKVVDSSQPQPTKREVDIMKRIEKLELHKQMRVPLVEGLVGFEDSHTEVIGFLQTEIESPTPLVKMLDEEVPQTKRDMWAKEAERMKSLLHENDIIWGDAKADNFMVDKHDKLWIIDFGGSYTEGWVDPELNETVEGDDMGVGRVVNALHDPEANTCDPEDDKVDSVEDEPQQPTSRSKNEKAGSTRKRKGSDEVVDTERLCSRANNKRKKNG